MGVGGQRHPPVALPPGKTRYPLSGGRVGPRAGLNGCGKSRPPPGFDPCTVQPVASHHTDWAIPAHILEGVKNSMAHKPENNLTALHCVVLASKKRRQLLTWRDWIQAIRLTVLSQWFRAMMSLVKNLKHVAIYCETKNPINNRCVGWIKKLSGPRPDVTSQTNTKLQASAT